MTIGNATALLGHADEGTTVRHFAKRTHVAPDLRGVIDQLVQQAVVDVSPGARSVERRAGYYEGPHPQDSAGGALRVAVAVGFEPTVDFHPHTLSRRAP